MNRPLRALRWLLLAGWFGSWALFAFVIAPTAFAVLPLVEAGALVAPVLRTLHLYGLGAGIALSAIAFAFRERPLLRWSPLILAALCAITEFGVTASISAIRPSGFGPDTPSDAAAQFDRLHLLSRWLFGLVLVGAGTLGVAHAVEPRGAGVPPEIDENRS